MKKTPEYSVTRLNPQDEAYEGLLVFAVTDPELTTAMVFLLSQESGELAGFADLSDQVQNEEIIDLDTLGAKLSALLVFADVLQSIPEDNTQQDNTQLNARFAYAAVRQFAQVAA